MNAYGMLQNANTGLGQSGRDKMLDTQISAVIALSRGELASFYRNSKICEKVVELLPKSATGQNWVELAIGKGRKTIPTKAIQYADDLNFSAVVREASILGRLDGDGFVVLGIDDGQSADQPVAEDRIRQISWAEPLSRYQLVPDVNSGRPGRPEFYNLYLLSNQALETGQTTGKIHRSRILRFPGKRLYGDLIVDNMGYNDSVLQAFYQSFVRYLAAIEYSSRMVQDYNAFVYKLKGLAQLILQGKEAAILKRFRTILMSLSSLGGLAMDAEGEDGQFVSRNFSGLDGLIDRLKDDTATASGLTPTRLWGSSQKAALSNSSEGDKFEWADCVDDWRSETLQDPTHEFFRLVLLAKNGPSGGLVPEGWSLKYKSALRLNLKEIIALRKDQTTGVDIPLLSKGVLVTEEVRAAWEGPEYSIERTLQPDLFTKAQEEKKAMTAPLLQANQANGNGNQPPTNGSNGNQPPNGTRPPVPPASARTDATDPLLNLLERTDRQLEGMEDAAIARLQAALEKSYADLQSEVLRRYSQDSGGSLLAKQRAIALLSQVSDMLGLVNTRNAEEIQQQLTDLLRGASDSGTSLAEELVRAVGNESAIGFAQVPVEAVAFAAQNAYQRLSRHSDDFREKASTIVTQGLIQGWGTDEIARQLRGAADITRSRAETIARTEALAAHNEAAQAAYAQHGLEAFQFIATADDRTCPYCSARNMRVYKMGESQPPVHPRCRCYSLPWSDRWQRAGLTRDDWATRYRNEALAALEDMGSSPNYGPTPFEQLNNLPVPTPIWSPQEAR